MSNIKDVTMTGDVPFNTNEHEELNKLIGELNAPTIGLKLRWSGRTRSEPNHHGGQTFFYAFGLTGQEAVQEGYLRRFEKAVRDAGGRVEILKIKDIENNELLVHEYNGKNFLKR
jgi:hypothetical protein